MRSRRRYDLRGIIEEDRIMTAVGLIFTNIHDNSIPELTRMRTTASIPFGGRYRLIDFMLSNMVNSGIIKVGVLTHNNYQSLLDHLETGKDWDLARRSGGIKILPPYIASFENTTSGRYRSSRLEALKGAVNFISRCNEEYVVMSDCDIICNIDLQKVIEAHANSGADITFVTKKSDLTGYTSHEKLLIAETDETGRIVDFTERKTFDGVCNVYANIMVMKREYLLGIVQDAIAHGDTSFLYDVINRKTRSSDFRIYDYEGWYDRIGSMEEYFSCSMKLLGAEAREGLFGVKNHPILTKVRNSAPTRYCEGASVKNSVVADGCIIEGTVENSIIFRGVKVCRGAVVKNSILFQDTYVCEGASLNCVITDKNVTIKDGRTLSGHESMPFYIGKKVTV